MVLRNAFENLSLESKQDITTTRLEQVKTVLDALEAGGAKNAQLIQVRDFVETVETLLSTLTGVDFATQTTLNAVLVKLNDIFGAVDGLEVTAGNIEFNAEAVNLQTDLVEDLLRQIRDRVGNIGDAPDLAGAALGQLRAIGLSLAAIDTQTAPLLDTGDTFYRLLNQMVPDGWFMETFIQEATDPNSIYFAMALRGTAPNAAAWDVIRIAMGVSGNPRTWKETAGVRLDQATDSTDPAWAGIWA